MKKIVAILLLIILVMSTLSPFAFAQFSNERAPLSKYFYNSFSKRMERMLENGTISSPVYVIFMALHYGLGLLGIILIPFVATYFLVKRKRTALRNKKLMQVLQQSDSSWEPKALHKHIKDSFYKIQQAIADKDAFKVKNLFEKSFYDEYDKILRQDRDNGTRCVILKLKLTKADPIQVFDHDDNNRDYVWYYIGFKKTDKTIVDGASQPAQKHEIVEYWKFVKRDNTWVLAKIAKQGEIPEFNY